VFIVDDKRASTYSGVQMTGWRGKVSAHLQISKKEQEALKKLKISEQEFSKSTEVDTKSSKEEVAI